MKVVQTIIDELNNINKSLPSSDTDQLKFELQNCFDVIKVVDNVSNGRITSLELTNIILQRRLNRSDIIKRGQPKKIKNLTEPIRRISSLCNICITDSDIHHCTYFITVFIYIINYNKNRNLLLRNVLCIEYSSNQSKKFVCVHLTDASKRLITMFLNLKSEGKIIRY